MGRLDKIKKTLKDKHQIRKKDLGGFKGGKRGKNGGRCSNPVPQ